MRKLTAVLLMLAVVAAAAPAQEEPAADAPRVRFEAVDVYVDSGDVPLAAWQFELAAEVGDVTIVGVEGGEHPAFADPPYYDTAALMGGRIIIAAFSTDADLPTGRTRVARIHVQVTGPVVPEYAVKLQAAGSSSGERINAAASASKGGEA
jgi:hypothetical protein